MIAQEKTAGVLDTPATVSQQKCTTIVGGRDANRKEFATLQAQFALRGYVLSRAYRVPDGRITYTVDRCTQRRAFSHLHDVQAFLNQFTGEAL